MPLLAIIGAIKISIYYEAGGKHHDFHIHVAYNEYKALYDLNGNIIKGEMPNPQNRAASEWIQDHREQLIDAWNKAMNNIYVDRIQ